MVYILLLITAKISKLNEISFLFFLLIRIINGKKRAKIKY